MCSSADPSLTLSTLPAPHSALSSPPGPMALLNPSMPTPSPRYYRPPPHPPHDSVFHGWLSRWPPPAPLLPAPAAAHVAEAGLRAVDPHDAALQRLGHSLAAVGVGADDGACRAGRGRGCGVAWCGGGAGVRCFAARPASTSITRWRRVQCSDWCSAVGSAVRCMRGRCGGGSARGTPLMGRRR